MGLNARAQEKESKKILTLTTSFPAYDGDPTGVFIARLLNGLQRLGYNIKVVCPSDGLYHGRSTVMGVETVRFGYFFPRKLERLTKRGGGIPENIKTSLLAKLQLIPMMGMFLLRSLWESRGYDILYANWIGAGIVGAVLNMITSKPLVVSFRGDDGYLARDRRIWRFLTLWVCRWSAKIAPVSSEIANILIELGVSREKIILPRFGVDTRLFRPLKSKKNQENTVDCLFVGSLIPRKGLHDLIEAMADESLGRMRLIVVGEGFQRENLVKRSNELGIGERVQWKGALSPDTVAQIMRNSDLLCLPAFMEGRPNVVNEAMSSGIPVVAARIGGIPDMVEEGATALLFEPGDVAGLRKQLKTLADDPQLRRKMGKRAREFVLESGISWDNTAEEFDTIFRSIV